jgi:hypothetical protein
MMSAPTWAGIWTGAVVQFVLAPGAFRPAFIVSIDSACVAELLVFTSISDVLPIPEVGLLVVRRTEVAFSDGDETGTWHYPLR